MPKKRAPAKTVEGRENQLIALAIDLAEKQLADGSASPSVIAHFLRLGSTNAQLERAKLEHETALLKAKTESIQEAKQTRARIEEAIEAMKSYRGYSSNEEFYDD